MNRRYRQRQEYLHRRRGWLAYLASVPRGSALVSPLGVEWRVVSSFGHPGGRVWIAADGWALPTSALAAELALGDMLARRGPVSAVSGAYRAARGHVRGFLAVPSVRLVALMLAGSLIAGLVVLVGSSVHP